MKPGLGPLVSIVTPVYNGERYLAECIESILAQTYENWEYVIVNNCSTDRTLEIAEQYAQQDRRIRVHNNHEFLGAVQNWNHALRQISAESKYCKILHADDWLMSECLTQMVSVAEMHPSAGLVGSYRLIVSPTSVEVGCVGFPYPNSLMGGRALGRLVLLGKLHVFGTPSSLLIRSNLIRERGMFYNDNRHAKYNGDAQACYEVLQTTDFGFAHQILTCTRQHDRSLTNSFANKLNTLLSGRLILLTMYGSIYLTNQEYEHRLQELMGAYHRFLGYSIFQLRDKAFWDYHRSIFKELGFSPNWIKITKASILRLIKAVIKPAETAQKVADKIGGRGLSFGLHR